MAGNKREENEQWLNNFLDKESNLNASYQNLVNAIQDTEKIDLDIKANISDINKTNNLIKQLETRQKQIINWKEKSKNNLKSRLSYLSLGVVEISRISHMTGDVGLKKSPCQIK